MIIVLGFLSIVSVFFAVKTASANAYKEGYELGCLVGKNEGRKIVPSPKNPTGDNKP